MSWKTIVAGLSRRYGSSAKFAVKAILGALVPGSSILIEIVEDAFGAARQQDDGSWDVEYDGRAQDQATLEQLGRMLEVIENDLQHLVAQLAELEDQPEVARKILTIVEKTDNRVQDAGRKLDAISRQLETIKANTDVVIAGQIKTIEILVNIQDKLDEPRTYTARDCIGTWRWRLEGRSIIFDLKPDGSFVAEDIPDEKKWGEGFGLVKTGKGYWQVIDGCLTVVMTHVWVLAFWTEHKVAWINSDRITDVSDRELVLERSSSLHQR